MKSILTKILILSFLCSLPALANDVGLHKSSAQPTRTEAKEKLDGAIGVCSPQLNKGKIDPAEDKAGWYTLDVRGYAASLFSQGSGKNPSLELDFDNAKITVLQAPKHGTISQGHYLGNDLSYYPSSNYEGTDKAIFLVDIEGHHVNVVYYFKVVRGNDNSKFTDDFKKYCPSPNWWQMSLPASQSA